MTLVEELTTQETEAAAALLLRRVGFGPTAADLDRVSQIGLPAFIDELFDPDANGVPDDGDPWSDMELNLLVESPEDIAETVMAWFVRMQDHSRPVSEWLAWFWHGHLVTSITVVRSPLGLAGQIRLFRDIGAGPLRALLRAITIDPAMLRYLDGNKNTGDAPNENYSRELLELFALGVGNYTEADVQAGAKALSGWTHQRKSLKTVFIDRRHDDTPQTYLGVDGVHDLDTVIDAVVNNPACPRFITRSLADAILGPGAAQDVLAEQATLFEADGLNVGPLIRRLADLALAGTVEPVVLAPVPWILALLRATDVRLNRRQLSRLLRSAGQVPMVPPNVSGWPSGDAWFSSSSTTARLEAARIIAQEASNDSLPLQAAKLGDLDQLARSLGRPEGFSTPTNNALMATDASGSTLLALALATPDLVIA